MAIVPWGSKDYYRVPEHMECKTKGHDNVELEKELLIDIIKQCYIDVYQVEISQEDLIMSLHAMRGCFFGNKTEKDPVEEVRVHYIARAKGLLGSMRIEKYPRTDEELVTNIGNIELGYLVCTRCKNVEDYKLAITSYLKVYWDKVEKNRKGYVEKTANAEDILKHYKEISHAN